MHNYLFLYLLVYIPVAEGRYKQATVTAREAALRQSGISDSWHEVRRAAEKRVPKQLVHTAVIYKIIDKQEMRVKHGKHVFVIRKNGVEAALRWEW